MKRIIFFILFIITSSTALADVLLKSLDGENISLSSLKGKWVLINYWAGWCSTCINEIPELNHFFHANKDKNVALFAVNFDRMTSSSQRKLIAKHDIQYPSLLNNPARELALGPIQGVPVTFVINPEGKVVNALYGGQSKEDLEDAIIGETEA